MGWQAEHIRDKFILGPGPPLSPPGPADGKRQLIRGEGLVAWISNDYRPQLRNRRSRVMWVLPRLEETVDIRTRSVGRAVRRRYSDSEDSDNDVPYLHICTDEHDSAVQRVNLRKEWSAQTTVDSCGDGCAQLDDF